MMVVVNQVTFAWTDYIDLFRTQKQWMEKIITELDITPQMAHGLHDIPESGSISMKRLAADLACDASNVTGLVDRLEARGFVKRQTDMTDRRVKCIVLTAAGKRLRKRLVEAFNQAPPAIAAMSLSDQRVLGTLIRRALDNASAQRLEQTG